MASAHEVKNKMSIYTVHEPLPRKDETSADPERFVFVCDGFYFWAFLLGPLWMLWRRLWLVTVLYVVGLVALHMLLWLFGVPGTARVAVDFLVALLIGFEAGTLWRWTLTRRGAKYLGVVVGDDLESAERHFFAAWTPAPQATSAPMAPPPKAWKPSASGDIVGLFPQPGVPR